MAAELKSQKLSWDAPSWPTWNNSNFIVLLRIFLTTKMTSPPADARNRNRNPLNLRIKIFPAIGREHNIRKCCEKLEGTITYQSRMIQQLKTQLDALVNENKLLDKDNQELSRRITTWYSRYKNRLERHMASIAGLSRDKERLRLDNERLARDNQRLRNRV